MWTLRQLETLRRMDRSARHGAGQIARGCYHTREQTDLARWAMLGRSIEDALTILNGSPGSVTGAVKAVSGRA